MMPAPSRGILSNSKKIQKINCVPTFKRDQDNPKKYTILPKLEKKRVLYELWLGVVEILGLDLAEASFSADDLPELIDRIPLPQYNNILKQVLAQHVANFEDKANVLTQWRKKIRNWIGNVDKCETRGGLAVPVEKAELFRQIVLQILEELPYRCFPTLRSRLLAVLRQWHYESQDPKPFKESTCSKHWWFEYQLRHLDIKQKWETLQLKKQVNKKNKMKSRLSYSQRTCSGLISNTEEEQKISNNTNSYENNFNDLYCDAEDRNQKNESFEVDDFFTAWDDGLAKGTSYEKTAFSFNSEEGNMF